MAWIFNPNDYEEKDFAPIPEGEHRVRIEDVVFKTFKTGNDGYEITLEVSDIRNQSKKKAQLQNNHSLWTYFTMQNKAVIDR